MTERAGGHFDGEAVLLGVLPDVSGRRAKLELAILSLFSNELFIEIAFPAAELVIEVGDGDLAGKRRSKLREQVEQDHGIDAAGNGDDKGSALFQEISCGDLALHLCQQVHSSCFTVAE